MVWRSSIILPMPERYPLSHAPHVSGTHHHQGCVFPLPLTAKYLRISPALVVLASALNARAFLQQDPNVAAVRIYGLGFRVSGFRVSGFGVAVVRIQVLDRMASPPPPSLTTGSNAPPPSSPLLRHHLTCVLRAPSGIFANPQCEACCSWVLGFGAQVSRMDACALQATLCEG